MSRQIEVHVLPDPAALAEHVAGWLLELAKAKGGLFSLCLSGGSTPKTLYHRLADPPYRNAFPWARTHLFWGDERFVPPTDELSNYRMVKEALLDHAPIPKANIHATPTTALNPDAAAAQYELDLKSFHGAENLAAANPLFDVNLLGLGEDGHTASLFPGTAVLQERTRWVAPVIGAKAEARITLTYPALDSSRHAAFLVTGEAKREILQRLRDGDLALPSSHVKPTGALMVFCDQAAAGV